MRTSCFTVLPVLLLLAGPGAFGAAHAAPAATHVVTDMAGRQVRLSTTVNRIVLIRGRDIYELSALLGDELPKKLIAWGSEIKSCDKDAYDAYCRRFPSLTQTPLIEDGNGSSDLCAEELVKLKPDLVIVDCYMLRQGYRSIGRFEQIGLPLFFVDESSDPLASPQASLIALGRALGKERRARDIGAYVDKRCNALSARLASLKTPPPTVYLEQGSAGVQKLGPAYSGKYAFGSLMAHARVTNVTASVVPTMAPVSSEFVLKCDPDMIVITGANWIMPDTMRLGFSATEPEAQSRLRGFLARPGWAGLKAVRNKRVYSIFHGFAMHIFDFAALEALVKYAYPDQFKDLDPEGDLQRFSDEYMPVKLTGVWMTRLI